MEIGLFSWDSLAGARTYGACPLTNRIPSADALG